MTTSVDYPTSYVMRYMGSKLRLLDFIVPILEAMLPQGEGFLDLMAGTHAVGYALKPNHPIVANDIQEYSRVIGLSRIVNDSFSPSRTDIQKDIFDRLMPRPKFHLFEELYKDTYFSVGQCRDIDQIRGAISQCRSPIRRAVYLTALIYAMGYCQSSPGHFAQYMPKDHPRLKSLRQLSIREAFEKKLLENHLVFSDYDNQVFAVDYRRLLTAANYRKALTDVKLVYIDPPYSEAQYSRFYHLLETVVKYDYPEVSHKGLYRGDRFQSNFGYKAKAPEEFDFIAATCSKLGMNLALSYSDRGLVPIDTLLEIARRYYQDVTLHTQQYRHSMQGRGVLKDLHEVLITARND